MTELPRRANEILLADDEPYNLEWISEYLNKAGYRSVTAVSVDEALGLLQLSRYRTVIADLSIPYKHPQPVVARPDPLHQRYPGLVIADYARNHGHLDRQVVVYSVHDDPLVQDFAKRIGVTYLLKGRPRHFKNELDQILEYDPLTR